jgi:DnaJ-class molecular chaperone
VGFFDRLSDLVKSYMDDGNDDWRDIKSARRRRFSTDPDVERAFDELEEFLRGGRPSGVGGKAADWSGVSSAPKAKRAVPRELGPDFAELELEFGASLEQCKAAHRRLLMRYHPDHNASHEGNMNKATAKSMKINAAWERISKWYEKGGL